MNRRKFIKAIGGGVVTRLSSAPLPAIGAAAIEAHLKSLSVFGRPAAGNFQSGVSRVGYSDADIAGRQLSLD
jgi:hypothetical protein